MSLEERSAYAAWRSHRANAAAMAEFERVWKRSNWFATASWTTFPPAMTILMSSGGLRVRPWSRPCARFRSSSACYPTYEDGHFWTALDWTDR